MATPGGGAGASGSDFTAIIGHDVANDATTDVRGAEGVQPAMPRDEAQKQYEKELYDLRREVTEVLARRGGRVTSFGRQAGIGGRDAGALLPEFYCLMLFPDKQITEIKTDAFDEGEQCCKPCPFERVDHPFVHHFAEPFDYPRKLMRNSLMAHHLICPSLYREERPYTFNGREQKEDYPLKIVREIVFDHVKKLKENMITAECSRLTGKDHHQLIKYPSLP